MSLVVYATERYDYMGEAVRLAGGFEAGGIHRQSFPDGERYRRLETSPRNRDVALIGGTITDADTLELFDLATTLVMQGARTLTLVVPYYGYSTMERAVRPGEVVAAKTRAMLLSAIPSASNGDRIMLLDLHSEGIPYYFEGSLRPIHLYGKGLVKEAARAIASDGFVLACTDAGRAKWVESLANDMGVRAAFVFKRRLSGEKTEVSAVSAQVEGQHVILYDDMIRTGSSLLEAARSYREAGATRVSAIATHGLFPEGALARIRGSGLIDRVICTDSHPRALALQDDYLTVVSVSGLFVEQLREGP